MLVFARGPTFAVNDGTIDATLSVRPFAGVPPNAIVDFAVTQTAQEGQLRLNWTAPTVFTGSTLDSYQIRVETISLTDVGGSTTTWWNASGGLLIQGFYGETPGQAVVRTLGPPGSDHLASLYPGATYYLAVRSADDMGVPRDFWSAITQISTGTTVDVAPATPSGLTPSVSTSALNLSWTDLSSAQKGLDFDGYRIYRSSQSGLNFALLGFTTGTSYSDSSAIAGFTYYYRVTAIDRGTPSYPGIALESAPTSEVSAAFGGTGTATPRRPNGLSMTSAGGQFTLNWHPVTLDANGQPITIDHYVVNRYDAIGANATVAVNVPAGTPTYTDTVGGLTYYYRVLAVETGGNLSAHSDYVDSSSQLNRYALSATDINNRMVIPMASAIELNAGNNGSSDDYEIVAIHQPQNENTVTLKSYVFQVQNARTAQIIPNFTFSQTNAAIQVSYALGAGVISLQQTGGIQGNQSAQAQAIAQLISLYWFNGSGFVRLGGTVILQDQALMVTVKNLGLYEIRAVVMPAKFTLTRGSPYPRLITPNGSENRRVFWFFDNPADEIVTGTIYDIRGAKVRDLAVDGLSPTSNSIVWDGRDMNGAVVPSGVYLYKIQAGKEKQTGTVVVAR